MPSLLVARVLHVCGCTVDHEIDVDNNNCHAELAEEADQPCSKCLAEAEHEYLAYVDEKIDEANALVEEDRL